VLESRSLLADGISPAAGPPINAVAGVPITNAVFATFTITDSTGSPGSQWLALIDFGDGQFARLVSPVPQGNGFAFLASHSYTTPGTYLVTVMIAIPMSHNPTDNVVTTHVIVAPSTATPTSPTPTSPTPTSTPTQTPTPSAPRATGSGTMFQTAVARTFHGIVADIVPLGGSTARNFHASINWGDGSTLSRGQVQGRPGGPLRVIGTHRYHQSGTFSVTVTILDATGQTTTASSVAQVVARRGGSPR
jgi:hypothetical protein